MSGITTRTLACGATLLIEEIPGVSSAAVTWLVPVGSATDPADLDGAAALLAELLFRGAGSMSSREHSDALDRLGARRSSSVGSHHLRLGAVCLGDRVDAVLDLVGMMVLHPTLGDDAVPAVRSLCLQALRALDDDPQHLVMLRLNEQHSPAPFNRHGMGEERALEEATAERLRQRWRERCRPVGSIISLAGNVDARRTGEHLERLLADWRGAAPDPAESAPPQRGHRHIHQDTSQVHIGLAWDAPPEPDGWSMAERLAVRVLSADSSARLFTEVRQKRSLCYSVGASYGAGRDRGMVSLYAGTTPERAQETLDVCAQEVRRLGAGVSAEELARAATGLKAALVMQGESTSARASAMANDFFRLGRARTLEEIAAQVDSVDLRRLNQYLRERPIGPFTVTSVGPLPVELAAVAAPA